jgi:hypothetical protein
MNMMVVAVANETCFIPALNRPVVVISSTDRRICSLGMLLMAIEGRSLATKTTAAIEAKKKRPQVTSRSGMVSIPAFMTVSSAMKQNMVASVQMMPCVRCSNAILPILLLLLLEKLGASAGATHQIFTFAAVHPQYEPGQCLRMSTLL